MKESILYKFLIDSGFLSVDKDVYSSFYKKL